MSALVTGDPCPKCGGDKYYAKRHRCLKCARQVAAQKNRETRAVLKAENPDIFIERSLKPKLCEKKAFSMVHPDGTKVNYGAME